MSKNTRKWRTAKRTGPNGTYWSLRSGRATERKALSLGYVAAHQASDARDQMNAEEARGHADVIMQWHVENRDAANRYLIGDPEVRDRFVVRPDYGAMQLRDYFEEEYKDWRAKEKPASWKQDKGRWRRINQELGDVRLRQIDSYVVADYLDGLIVLKGRRVGKPASGTTRRLHRAAIQALLKRAHRRKHILELPNLAVFPIHGASERVTPKPDPLDLHELHRLMQISSPKFRCMWAVGTSQGLRPMELNRIRWEDIDFKKHTMRVRGRTARL
jgi:hypothetical protein